MSPRPVYFCFLHCGLKPLVSLSQLHNALNISGGSITSSFANVVVKGAKVSKIYESDADLFDCMPSRVDHFTIIEWLVVLGCAAFDM